MLQISIALLTTEFNSSISEELTHFRNIRDTMMNSSGHPVCPTHLFVSFEEQYVHFIQNQVAESKE